MHLSFMEVINEIKDRRSYRSFSNEEVSEHDIKLMFTAAQYAASSNNAQAWKYYATKKGTDSFNRLLDCLAPGNQSWAKNAPLLILSTAQKHYPNGNEYTHAWHDVGLANSHLVLQATALGMFGHMMGGYSAEKAIQVVDLPDSHEPVCVIAIGYRGDGNELTDSFKERENSDRIRKSLNEVLTMLS
jgi:nitroreductase